jgi:hypothetical protein
MKGKPFWNQLLLNRRNRPAGLLINSPPFPSAIADFALDSSRQPDSEPIVNTNCLCQSGSLSAIADATFQRKVAHLKKDCPRPKKVGDPP